MSALVGGTYSTNGPAASPSTSKSSLVSQPAVVVSGISSPTLTASYPVRSAVQDLSTLTTPSFTPATGEIIVLKAIAEDFSMPLGTPTASGGGIAWTKQVENSTSKSYQSLWTGTVTVGGSAITVSVPTASANNSYHSMVVERWTGAALGGTPNSVLLSGSGAPSTTITTVQINSVVSWMNGDWAAVAPGVPAYRSGAVQEFIDDRSTVNYVGYYATQTTAALGVQTIGMTAPSTQNYALMAIEIQGVAGSQPPVASAGSPQTVASQAVVTLAGSGTNSPTSYAWTQTSGTAVTLSSLTVAAPTFTAPADPAGQTLIFSLTATNANGTSAASTVTITVTPQTEWIYYAGSWQPTKSVLL